MNQNSELSGAQKQKLQTALLSAFRNYGDLRQMVQFQLDERLENITASNGSLADAIFELILWAESQGRMRELIEGACAHVPGNPALRTLQNELVFLSAPSRTDVEYKDSEGYKADSHPNIIGEYTRPGCYADFRKLSFSIVVAGFAVGLIYLGFTTDSGTYIIEQLRKLVETPMPISTPTDIPTDTSTPRLIILDEQATVSADPSTPTLEDAQIVAIQATQTVEAALQIRESFLATLTARPTSSPTSVPTATPLPVPTATPLPAPTATSEPLPRETPEPPSTEVLGNLRTDQVTGSLPGGEFAKIWLGLEPKFPDADIRLEITWGQLNAAQNGLFIAVLNPEGLNKALTGISIRDVALAQGNALVDGSSSQMEINFNAVGFTTYTVVIGNDSTTATNFAAIAQNSLFVDDSGQVEDCDQPFYFECILR